MPSSYDNSPLHTVGFKVSHNSYDLNPFDLQPFYDGGCRGIELDISQQPNHWEWCVRHGPWSASAPRLSVFLQALRAWAPTGHDPMFVHIDLKSGDWSNPSFPDRFDGYLAEHLGDFDRVFTPDQMMIGPGDLMQHGMALGWPTIKEISGHYVFCLSGAGGKEQYAKTNAMFRACFADINGFAPVDTDEGPRIITNVDLNNPPPSWTPFIQWMKAKRALLNRVYNINSAGSWKVGQDAGFNMLAVDQEFALDPTTGPVYWSTGGSP